MDLTQVHLQRSASVSAQGSVHHDCGRRPPAMQQHSILLDPGSRLAHDRQAMGKRYLLQYMQPQGLPMLCQ